MAMERRILLRWREEWTLALLVLLGALAVRLLLGISLGPSVPIADDQRDYLSLARQLALTRHFGDPPPAAPTAFRDPAYPAFLALLGAGSPLGRIWVVQVLLSAATGLLVVLAAWRAQGRTAAWWTAALFLLSADFAVYGFITYTETLACFSMGLLLLGMSWGMDRPRAGGRVAAALGAALTALTRTAGDLGVVGAAASMWRVSAAGRRTALVALLATILVVGLWSARNLLVVGSFAPNTNGALNLYLGNNPRAPLVHGYRAMNDPVVWRPLQGLSETERARKSLALTREYVTTQPTRAALGVLGRIPDALELDRILIGVGRRGQFPSRSPRMLMLLGMAVAALTVVPRVLALATVLSPGNAPLARMGRWIFLGILVPQLLTIAAPRLLLPAWILLIPGSAVLLLRVRAGERQARVALVVSALILAPVWIRQALLG